MKIEENAAGIKWLERNLDSLARVKVRHTRPMFEIIGRTYIDPHPMRSPCARCLDVSYSWNCPDHEAGANSPAIERGIRDASSMTVETSEEPPSFSRTGAMRIRR